MSQDRLINWKNKKATKEEIKQVIKNFLGGIGEVSNWEDVWLSIGLPGKLTNPLKNIKDVPECANFDYYDPKYSNSVPQERWFEVFWSEEYISVITRPLADEFTTTLATQVAKIIARWWEAELEGPG